MFPCRGGTRGGKDQFSWEDVKNAPDKTYYLGSSVKAVSGRWQEGKDVFWYTKGREGSEKDVQDEIKAIKEREDALMRQALGLQPVDGYADRRQDLKTQKDRRDKSIRNDVERRREKRSRKSRKNDSDKHRDRKERNRRKTERHKDSKRSSRRD